MDGTCDDFFSRIRLPSAGLPTSTSYAPTRGAPTDTPEPTLLPTVSALTPEGFYPTAPPLVVGDLPRKVMLKGAHQEYQRLNNCGPATLTAALTYWGWQGSKPLAADGSVRWQDDIA